MIEQVKTAYRYLLVMGSGAVLLLLSVMVPVVSSSADFSIYNTGWNGCSQLGRDTYSSGSLLPTVDIHASTEEVIAHSSFADMDDVLEPESSVIIIIGPDVPFTGREGRFAHTFLTEGAWAWEGDGGESRVVVVDHPGLAAAEAASRAAGLPEPPDCGKDSGAP